MQSNRCNMNACCNCQLKNIFPADCCTKVSCGSYSTNQLFIPKNKGNNCSLKNDGKHLLDSEIIPTRCNNCVYSSQWFTLQVSGDNSTHHQEYNAVYGLSGRQVYLCCNFVNILVVLSLSVVLSCR